MCSSLFPMSSFSKRLFLACLHKPRATGLRSFQPFLLNYLHQRVNNLFRPAEAAERARPFCKSSFRVKFVCSFQTFAITWCYKFWLRKTFVRNFCEKKKFQLPLQTMTLSGSWLAQIVRLKHNMSEVWLEWVHKVRQNRGRSAYVHFQKTVSYVQGFYNVNC